MKAVSTSEFVQFVAKKPKVVCTHPTYDTPMAKLWQKCGRQMAVCAAVFVVQ